jgi:hypothetical protein
MGFYCCDMFVNCICVLGRDFTFIACIERFSMSSYTAVWVKHHEFSNFDFSCCYHYPFTLVPTEHETPHFLSPQNRKLGLTGLIFRSIPNAFSGDETCSIYSADLSALFFFIPSNTHCPHACCR